MCLAPSELASIFGLGQMPKAKCQVLNANCQLPPYLSTLHPMTYTVHQAKTNLSKLLKEAEAGQEVIIARGKVPVAKLVALHDARPAARTGARPRPPLLNRLPTKNSANWICNSVGLRRWLAFDSPQLDPELVTVRLNDLLTQRGIVNTGLGFFVLPCRVLLLAPRFGTDRRRRRSGSDRCRRRICTRALLLHHCRRPWRRRMWRFVVPDRQS